ncbi:MAG: GNAT family N-acetyltransferase [Candidatus Brocadiia bacterium]
MSADAHSIDPYRIRPLRTDEEREAELLADMWNRSDEGWPGGWTGGTPATAERMQREFLSSNSYGQWVCQHEGEIVGYVSLEANPNQPQHAYVGLLNARPDHHGKGVGRRLLRRALQTAIDAGFERVDINTWPANRKAVPLYKKTGFFWSPETSVLMQNFIPTILRMPLLADLFEGHDWYRIQERELDVCEDVDYWHDVRVYRYRFATDQHDAEVVVDRQAAMVTGLETDELAVSAWVGAEELPALQEHTVHYELRNKTDRPMSVSLLVHGEQGVPVTAEESFELVRRKQLSIPFRLPAELERRKPGEPPHRVLSTVVVDGVPVRLGTAVPARDPVEIEYHGEGLPAGKWTELRIKLRNRLPFRASGRLAVGLPEGVECEAQDLQFSIPRGKWGNVSLRLRAGEPASYPLELHVCFDDETAARLAKGETPAPAPRGRTRTVWLRVFAPGTFAWSDDEERREVTVESDRLRLVFRRATEWGSGWLSLHDKCAGQQLMSFGMPELGPPFGDFRAVPEVFDADVRRVPGGIEVTTRRRVDRFPGVTLERRLTLSAGVLKVEHVLLNSSNQPADVQVRWRCRGGLNRCRFTLPLGDGLVQHERAGWSDWPGWDEVVQRGGEFPERWVAADRDGLVCGVVWEGDPEVSPSGDGGTQFTWDGQGVPAASTVALSPVYLVAGSGDWKVVRSFWSTYAHPGRLTKPEEKHPPRRDVLHASFGQEPLVLTDGAREVTLELTSEQERALRGRAELALPDALALEDGARELAIDVEQLDRDHAVRRPLTLLPRSALPTAAVAELRFTSQRQVHTFDVPLIALGPAGECSVESDEDTVAVDTGCISFRSSAEHGGSVASLLRDEREFLRSSYPTAEPYQWMNPWYGGIRGFVGSDWDRKLHDLKTTIEPTSVKGRSGRQWRGASLRVTPQHKDWAWLRYDVRYLATAGSNLLAVLVEAHRRVPAPMGANVQVDVWPSGETSRAWVKRDGNPEPFFPDRYNYDIHCEGWLAFECAEDRFLSVVPAGREHIDLSLDNLGDGQMAAHANRRADLTPPVKSLETLVWVVACRSLEEAYAYRCLRDMTELP